MFLSSESITLACFFPPTWWPADFLPGSANWTSLNLSRLLQKFCSKSFYTTLLLNYLVIMITRNCHISNIALLYKSFNSFVSNPFFTSTLTAQLGQKCLKVTHSILGLVLSSLALRFWPFYRGGGQVHLTYIYKYVSMNTHTHNE